MGRGCGTGGMHRTCMGWWWCVNGGCGMCMRLWLGLGHMKGVQDMSGMVAAH